jgi:hypothetical protein
MNRALWLFVLTLLGLHLWKDENVQLLPPRGAINYRVVDKMKRVCNDLLKERYVNRYDISNMQVFDQTVGFPGEGPDEGHSKRKSPGKSSSDDPQHEGGLKKKQVGPGRAILRQDAKTNRYIEKCSIHNCVYDKKPSCCSKRACTAVYTPYQIQRFRTYYFALKPKDKKEFKSHRVVSLAHHMDAHCLSGLKGRRCNHYFLDDPTSAD